MNYENDTPAELAAYDRYMNMICGGMDDEELEQERVDGLKRDLRDKAERRASKNTIGNMFPELAQLNAA